VLVVVVSVGEGVGDREGVGSRKSLRVVLLVGVPRSGLARKRCSLGGSGGMPPKKIFVNMDALRCNLVHS